MTRNKSCGMLSDLTCMGMSIRHPKGEKETTIIEFHVPFVVTFKSDCGESKSVFSIKDQETGLWGFELKGYFDSNSERNFKVTAFTGGTSSQVIDFVPSDSTDSGKRLLESFITPFSQEYDDFTGSFVGIDAKGNIVKKDLGMSSQGYYPEDLLEDEALNEFVKNNSVVALSIFHQYAYADERNYLYVDLVDMNIYHKEICLG